MVNRSIAARAMVWSTLENGGLLATSLLSLILYSRLLDAVDFGVFSIVWALIELLGILPGMLFHDALVQRRNVNELHYNTAFTFVLGLSIVMVAVCWLLAPILSAAVNEPSAGQIFSWLSLSFPLAGGVSTIVARQRRALQIRPLAIRSLVGRILGAGAGVTAALAGLGLWSLVIQSLAMTLVGSVVLWITCDKHPHFRFGMREFRDLITFGGTAVSTLFFSFAVKRLYTVLVGIGLGATEAGVLNLSFRSVDMFWGLAVSALEQVALPMLANLQFDHARLKRAYQDATKFACIVLFPCFVGLGATSPEVIELLFGSKWLPSSPSMTALAILVVVQVPRLFVTPLLTAVGRPHAPLIFLAIQMIFVFLAMTSVEALKISSALGIWITCEIIAIPLTTWLIYKYLGFTIADQYKGVLVPLVAAVFMLTGIIIIRTLIDPGLVPIARLSIMVPIGAIIFCTTLFLLDRQLVNSAIALVYQGVRRGESLSLELEKNTYDTQTKSVGTNIDITRNI